MILIPPAHNSQCQGLMFEASGPLNHFVQTQGLQHKRTTRESDRGSGRAGSHELRDDKAGAPLQERHSFKTVCLGVEKSPAYPV